jgi:hypothetical protein
MNFMANELRQQRPAANVMAWIRSHEQAATHATEFSA